MVIFAMDAKTTFYVRWLYKFGELSCLATIGKAMTAGLYIVYKNKLQYITFHK